VLKRLTRRDAAWRMDSGQPQKPCIHRRQRRRGCRGRDPPQYLTRRGLWRHGFASLYRSFGTNWYFYKVYHTTIQSMGHMNLKNNTPRMHHITPFWDEKFVNFLERGTAPPQTTPPRRIRRLDSRVFGARPATPNVPVALTPMPVLARRGPYLPRRRGAILGHFRPNRPLQCIANIRRKSAMRPVAVTVDFATSLHPSRARPSIETMQHCPSLIWSEARAASFRSRASCSLRQHSTPQQTSDGSLRR